MGAAAHANPSHGSNVRCSGHVCRCVALIRMASRANAQTLSPPTGGQRKTHVAALRAQAVHLSASCSCRAALGEEWCSCGRLVLSWQGAVRCCTEIWNDLPQRLTIQLSPASPLRSEAVACDHLWPHFPLAHAGVSVSAHEVRVSICICTGAASKRWRQQSGNTTNKQSGAARASQTVQGCRKPKLFFWPHLRWEREKPDTGALFCSLQAALAEKKMAPSM